MEWPSVLYLFFATYRLALLDLQVVFQLDTTYIENMVMILPVFKCFEKQ